MTVERVVVTGMGAITPLGNDVKSTFAAAAEGKSGVSRLSFAQHPRALVEIAAQIHDFDPKSELGGRHARRLGRFCQLALTAAREAVSDAGLAESGYARERIAVVIGVGFGGLELIVEGCRALDEQGPHRVSPHALVGLIPNMAAAVISIEHGAKGPSYCLASACASSAHAIGDALSLLRRGAVDAVIAGGAEATITPLGLAAFARMGALSTRNGEPERASRPFDAARDGFVMGEGAGVLVLELEAAARRRGATIRCELAGYGASADAFHVVKPCADADGPHHCMAKALADAKLNPSDVDYISAHGTSTPDNDVVESRAIERLFGVSAKQLWVSSAKSMMGHLLGAAGAVEAVLAVRVIETGVVTPTLNLERPGDGCNLDYVPNAAREKRVRNVLSNSFGFGGQNAALVFRAYHR